jgi:hypothetical protein
MSKKASFLDFVRLGPFFQIELGVSPVLCTIRHQVFWNLKKERKSPPLLCPQHESPCLTPLLATSPSPTLQYEKKKWENPNPSLVRSGTARLEPAPRHRFHIRWRGRQQQGVVITVALGESGAQRAGGVPSVLVKSSVRRARSATLGVRAM